MPAKKQQSAPQEVGRTVEEKKIAKQESVNDRPVTPVIEKKAKIEENDLEEEEIA